MSEFKKERLFWSVPLIVAAIFAVFWGIWFFFTGSVPVVGKDLLTRDMLVKLPFPVSRWWDILSVAVSALLFVRFLLYPKKGSAEEKALGRNIDFDDPTDTDSKMEIFAIVFGSAAIGFVVSGGYLAVHHENGSFWSILFPIIGGLLCALFQCRVHILAFCFGFGLLCGQVYGLIFALLLILLIFPIGRKFKLNEAYWAMIDEVSGLSRY